MKRYYFILSGFAPLVFWFLNFFYFLTKKSPERQQALIFGLMVVLLNSFFFISLNPRNKRLAYFFQGTALLVQILILIFLVLG